MSIQQAIIAEYPELKPYIFESYHKVKIGYQYENTELYFWSYGVRTWDYKPVCEVLTIENHIEFPLPESYDLDQIVVSKDEQEILSTLTDSLDDVKTALEYFEDYNPKQIADELEYLGWEALNKEKISFEYKLSNKQELYIQLPSEGASYFYSFTANFAGAYDKDYCSLDELLGDLMDEY